MVQRIGGSRRKSRKKFKKPYREKGKTSLHKYLQEFSEGDRVRLVADPSVQSGLYHHRFHGTTGSVTGEQGKCFTVRVEDGDSEKELVVHPAHLREVDE